MNTLTTNIENMNLEEALRPEKEKLYMTVTRAKDQYFLTDSMIKKIGEEDKVVPNPHFRRSAPMRLYLISRIEQWVSENLDLVDKARIRRQKLSKIQLEVHEKKREKMRQLTDSWQPQLDIDEDMNEIIEEARDYYDYRYDDFDGKVTRGGLIAFIRHQYTDYERFLLSIDGYKGHTGVGLLYLPLRSKVDAMIEQYLVDHNIEI